MAKRGHSRDSRPDCLQVCIGLVVTDDGRVKAHILVCFLAYVLWKSLAQWMRRAGLGDAPRTVLQEFAKIKSGDMVLHCLRQE